jgi:hypothetical protein
MFRRRCILCAFSTAISTLGGGLGLAPRHKEISREFFQNKKNLILTGLVIDIVGTDLTVVGLLPSQRQFVSDAIGERLRFREPVKRKKS